LLVGLEHGVARDAEVARQRARRREPRAAAQATGQDRAAQRAVDLSVERAVAVERELHRGAKWYHEELGSWSFSGIARGSILACARRKDATPWQAPAISSDSSATCAPSSRRTGATTG